MRSPCETLYAVNTLMPLVLTLRVDLFLALSQHFFPQNSSKEHDHSYIRFSNALGDSVVDDEGREENIVLS